MTLRHVPIARLLGTAVMAAVALVCMPIGNPLAVAAPCPDVEVVFARGTTEAPGVGGIGQAFVDSVRSQLDGRSVGVYAVNYPASTDFPTAATGVIDASSHVRAMAADCPNTKIVLGGFSQGAAVIGYVTADAVPAGFPLPTGLSGPMPPDVANHVAAVALFGKPSGQFLNAIEAPPLRIGALYAAKTIDLCNPEDPVCSVDGDNGAAHVQYAENGMTKQAADFAVQRV
jgi:cutinase